MATIHAYPYWDFDATEADLELWSPGSPLGTIVRLGGGPRRFLRVARALQGVLNSFPMVRRQGNKFFCLIEKTGRLRPWLTQDGERVVFNPTYLRPGDKNGARG